PSTSTGRSSGAARLARSTASRKDEDWPTSWVLRSIVSLFQKAAVQVPTYWIFHHLLASEKRHSDPSWRSFSAVFRHFPELARSLLRKAHSRRMGRRDGNEDQVQGDRKCSASTI